VFPALQTAAAPLLNDGRLWRMQLDTYEREIERYGGEAGMVLAERLFHADSDAILALTNCLGTDARGDRRWRLALVGIDLLLTDLGFDPETRCALMHRTRELFAAEVYPDTSFKYQLGARFRVERSSLETLLDHASPADPQLAEGREILRCRSRQWAPVMVELKECARERRLTVPLPELATSYLHMHVNRLLRSAHRAQELVLYDFLGRLYESQVARGLQ
jgi:thiopeptide-type bacteriocin biosynthesis protein